MSKQEEWKPSDLDGSNGVEKQFIAKCRVEVGAGGFLRFPLAGDKKTRNWLDERLMALFISTQRHQAAQEATQAERQRCFRVEIPIAEAYLINKVRKVLATEGVLSMSVEKALDELAPEMTDEIRAKIGGHND